MRWPAPNLLTTTTGRPKTSRICSATARAPKSMEEAAPTRIVMGEVSCANTFVAENSNELANIPSIALRLVVILSPIFYGCCLQN